MKNMIVTSLACFLPVAAAFIVILHSRPWKKANECISFMINWYLVWRYPIKAVGDGRLIPTCPYRWPNGQGDVAKFLEGEVNSKKWEAEYGPIYRIWSGMRPEIVVTTPEDIQCLYADSDKHFKALNNDSGWLMGELLGKCLGLINGDAYQQVRAGTMTHFTHKSATSYLPQIVRITDEYFKTLSREGCMRENTINPIADLKFLPFWIIVGIIYGELTPEMRSNLESLVDLREALWGRMIQGGASRYAWSQYFHPKLIKDLKDFKKRWVKFNEDAYEGCILAKEDVAIVGMYEEVKRGQVGEEEMLQTIDEMLFANLDVTMGGLSWNLLFLAKYQDTQEDVRQEIHLAKGSEMTGHNRDSYLKSSSTLLACSILESSRLKPLAAFSVAQSAPTTRTVHGFLIPAKTNFIVDTHALNIRNPYWGPDNENYRPFRFLNTKPSEMRYQFWRFGFGPRQCLGKYVVDLILRATIAHLVENYRLSMTEGTHWEKDPANWIQHPNTVIGCERLET